MGIFDRLFGNKLERESIKELRETGEKNKVEKFVVFIVTDKPSPLSSNTSLVKKLLNQCNISMPEGFRVIIDIYPEVARGEGMMNFQNCRTGVMKEEDMKSTIPWFVGRAKRFSSEENLEYDIGEMAIQNFYSPELAVSGWIASIPMFRKIENNIPKDIPKENKFYKSQSPEADLINDSSKAIPNNLQNSIGMEFALISAGEFMMGSDEGDTEKPVHIVKTSRPFYLGIYPVTQREWEPIMGDNPSHFKGDKLPVESVSWNDVQEFIRKLNEKEGTDKYRLPSEAEWEYAARAGTTTRYSFGDDESKLGDYDKSKLLNYAWYDGNSGSKTHEVGQKKPNPWGLYDMHGNVWEWVQDIYHDSYNCAPTDGSAWEGNDSGRVARGGSWDFLYMGCRSSFRIGRYPVYRGNNVGFRLLMDL